MKTEFRYTLLAFWQKPIALGLCYIFHRRERRVRRGSKRGPAYFAFSSALKNAFGPPSM